MSAPVIISTWTFGMRGNEAAWPDLVRGGSSLDAVERAAQIVEADEEVDTVGRGGLPDALGRVSLDGCIMLAPARNGAVVAVREHLHVVSIARCVMERTNHFMLAGDDADAFADRQGFERCDLLTDAARQRWEAWKRNPSTIEPSKDYGLTPFRAEAEHDTADRARKRNAAPRQSGAPTEADWAGHDTISTLALDAAGVLAGSCSTSGSPYKVPGRVGDSPIIGHGLYVDPAAGGAAATGTGELIMGVSASFLAVEQMRAGRTPIEALMLVLDRIAGAYELRPNHQVGLLAMTPGGAFASASLRSGFKVSITTSDRCETVEPDYVLSEG